MKNSMKWAAAATLGLFASFSASAATWTANGSITSVTNNFLGLMPNWVGLNDQYSFTFDTPASPSGVETPFLGVYGGLFNASLTVTSATNSNSPWTYNFSNNGLADTLTVTNTVIGDGYNASVNDRKGLALGAANLTLTGPQSIFTSAAFPSSQPNTGLFANGLFTFSTGLEGFVGSVSGLNVAPVPLPAAAWLLLSGLAGVAAFARRRRREELPLGAAA